MQNTKYNIYNFFFNLIFSSF